jgi:hypothetical protein
LVDHVYRDAPRPCGGGNCAIYRIVIGGGDHHCVPGQILVSKIRCAVYDPGRGEIGVEGRAQRWREHRDPRAGAYQQRHLARRDFAATNHQAGLVTDVEKDRQKFHGVLCARSRAGPSI